MALTRSSLIAARNLGRSLGPWPFVFVLGWGLLTRLQEPSFFILQGLPFFWSSQLAMLAFLLGLLPLAWRLTAGAGSAAWIERTARSSTRPALTTWLGLVLYGTPLILWSVVSSIAIDSLSAWRISASLGPVGVLWSTLQAGAFLLITASLAPALVAVRWATPTLVAAWLTILALALLAFGPSEFSEPPSAATVLSGIVSTFLATLGGLALSSAHSSRQRSD